MTKVISLCEYKFASSQNLPNINFTKNLIGNTLNPVELCRNYTLLRNVWYEVKLWKSHHYIFQAISLTSTMR